MDSTNPLTQVVAGGSAAATVNEVNDAMGVAALYGRRAAATTGLTWAWFGGRFNSISIANGTVALGASTTTYLVAHLTTGAVTAATNTINWDDTATYMRLYKIVTGASTVTSYEDHRQAVGGSGGGGGSPAASAVSVADAGGYYTGTDVEAVLQEIGASLGAVVGLPRIQGENAVWSDEGLSATGWSTSNGTLSVEGSRLRLTKGPTGGSAAFANKALTFTPTNRDFILYGKVRAKYASNSNCGLWFLNGSKEFSIWFGSNNASSAITQGAVSIKGTTGPSTGNVASVATGLDYEAAAVEFALQFDSKFTSLTCFFKNATTGLWEYKGRVACDWFDSTQISLFATSASANGSWVEFDYLMLTRPNLMVIGDSIAEGKTLFSPDRAAALTNWASTWMAHARLYPNLRNNLVVNKGVGSNTSAQILARVTDVTAEGPQLVFVHASSNDEAGGVSQTTRSANIQGTIDAIVNTGAEACLLNGMYATAASADNLPTPDLRDYQLLWWGTNRATLQGLKWAIDIMQPLLSSGFQSAALTQSDGIHPTVAGYTEVGEYVQTFAPATDPADELTAIDNSVQDFRLTLTSGVPVTPTDVTAATTLYFTPFQGNRVALHNGAVWKVRRHAEISIAVPATTATVYDVFLVDAPGVPFLELLAWSSGTARATALVMLDGVRVKSGDSKRRYVGTIRTAGVSGQTEDSRTKRFVWNQDNRAVRPLRQMDTTASWTYASATWRQARASAANQVEVVIGLAEDQMSLNSFTYGFNSTATGRIVRNAVGQNSTSAPTDTVGGASVTDSVALPVMAAPFVLVPAIGYHYFALLEQGHGADTQTFLGVQGGGNCTGITGMVRA